MIKPSNNYYYTSDYYGSDSEVQSYTRKFKEVCEDLVYHSSLIKKEGDCLVYSVNNFKLVEFNIKTNILSVHKDLDFSDVDRVLHNFISSIILEDGTEQVQSRLRDLSASDILHVYAYYGFNIFEDNPIKYDEILFEFLTLRNNPLGCMQYDKTNLSYSVRQTLIDMLGEKYSYDNVLEWITYLLKGQLLAWKNFSLYAMIDYLNQSANDFFEIYQVWSKTYVSPLLFSSLNDLKLYYLCGTEQYYKRITCLVDSNPSILENHYCSYFNTGSRYMVFKSALDLLSENGSSLDDVFNYHLFKLVLEYGDNPAKHLNPVVEPFFDNHISDMF